MPLPFQLSAEKHQDKIAIKDEAGNISYSDLLKSAKLLAAQLLADNTDLKEARIAFISPSNRDYVIMQWAIWLAGGLAVPLCIKHPLAEMKYVVEDAQAEILLVHPDFKEKLLPLKKTIEAQWLNYQSKVQTIKSLPKVDVNRRAMMLYTSGTTGKPKGVVSTHANINAQVEALLNAWQWTDKDHIIHILPLHHTHGIINKLCCALWSGAICEMLPGFDAEQIWNKFNDPFVTLFMAVPTVYHRLIQHWQEAPNLQQTEWSNGAASLRLMVSGSAALPVSTLERWQEIAGQTLLERYGMTEIGMALSNAYDSERFPGKVGRPLPGVQTRIVDESGQLLTNAESGELQVKGPTVFKEYWNRPVATLDAFTEDGWFKTGDIVQEEQGIYKIVGRNSVDIIKTGGYKVSALEIEEQLRKNPRIKECAIVALPDDTWGEIVAAALVLSEQDTMTLAELRNWCRDLLAPYKIPSKAICLPSLPRNVMGKVTKPKIKQLFN